MKPYNKTCASLLWIGIYANICSICSILICSLYMQIVLGEFPCPLCITQRISMILCALGQVYILSCVAVDGHLHLKYVMIGNSMTLFAALGGSTMSIRQILLHIVPPDPGYAEAIFGLHMYT